MTPDTTYCELRTIIANLELALERKDWRIVDNAIMRLAMHAMKAGES